MDCLAILTAIIGAFIAAWLLFFPYVVKKPGVYKHPSRDTLSQYKPGEKTWCVDPSEELPIRLAKEGPAAGRPYCVMEMFTKAAKKAPNVPALRVERNGAWQTWTWSEYHDMVRRTARSFISLGLQPFEAVNVIGFNAPEWLFANLGAIAAGGMAAGIYTTNTPEACKYISEHSEARVVVVEDEKQLDKFLQVYEDLPKLSAIVVYNGKVPAECQNLKKIRVYSWSEFMSLGEEVSQHDLDARIAAQRPGQCCTLIYTSGTTGNPKAVMISHDNLTFLVQSVLTMTPSTFGFRDEHIISYLPLSHIAAQLLDIYAPIAITAYREGHCTLHFARPDALKGSLGDTLKAVRPTLFFGVPRVWEKVQEKLLAVGAKKAGFLRQIAQWAKYHGLAGVSTELYGGDGKKGLGFWVAKNLILNPIHKAIGLDRCIHAATGAAPISPDTLKYYGSLYIPIKELYGMSESTGPVTSCMFDLWKMGSVGVPLPGCEVKIDHLKGRDKEGEGEVCFRGRLIMMGYMKNKDKTAETIDSDGWLHSGDVGRMDKDGFVYITGRIKELIITAGGENIAPVPIEDRLKELMPAVSNVMMIGDKRKYNVLLVTLRTEANEDGSFNDKLAGEALNVSSARTVGEAQKDPVWEKYVTSGIQTYNKEAVSNAQKIQKFRILPRDFSTTTEELTATLKLKRPVVNNLYEDLIEEMY